MSKRDWDGTFAPWIALAVGLAAIALISTTVFYSKGYQRANQDHQSDYADRNEANNKQKECLAKTTIKEAVECANRTNNASRDDQRSEQDLNAQREMADWAEGMLWATIVIGGISLIVTGIGLFYINRSLNAQIEANRIANREQRPWISISDLKVTVRDITFDGTYWLIHIRYDYVINNTGTGAAENINIVSIPFEGGLVAELPPRVRDMFQGSNDIRNSKFHNDGKGFSIAPNSKIPWKEFDIIEVKAGDWPRIVYTCLEILITYNGFAIEDHARTFSQFSIETGKEPDQQLFVLTPPQMNLVMNSVPVMTRQVGGHMT